MIRDAVSNLVIPFIIQNREFTNGWLHAQKAEKDGSWIVIFQYDVLDTKESWNMWFLEGNFQKYLTKFHLWVYQKPKIPLACQWKYERLVILAVWTRSSRSMGDKGYQIKSSLSVFLSCFVCFWYPDKHQHSQFVYLHLQMGIAYLRIHVWVGVYLYFIFFLCFFSRQGLSA